MKLTYKNLTIRNATVEDAFILSNWWNDGELMKHAGFPNGTGQTPEMIVEQIKHDSHLTQRRMIIEENQIPIGEMIYFHHNHNIAEIGIKICVLTRQNQGIGKTVLSMLINKLFCQGYKKIILDTSINNKLAQHVYEKLGFMKMNTDIENAAIEYELVQENFHSYLDEVGV